MIMLTGKLLLSGASPFLSDATDFFFPRFIVSAILIEFDSIYVKKINTAENLSFQLTNLSTLNKQTITC